MKYLTHFKQHLLLNAVYCSVLSVGTVAVASESKPKASESDQLHAPTHRQVRLIEPKLDGEKVKLHTIATTRDGMIVAGVGGQSMKYEMTAGGGYEPKLVEQPSAVLLLDSQGETITRWDVELTPTALAVAPDGTIYAGGSGRVVRLDPDGSIGISVDSPHAGKQEDVRAKVAEMIRKSRTDNSEVFERQINLLKKQVAKIEEKEEDDRSRLEQAQLKAFQSQIEAIEKMIVQTDDDDESEEPKVDDSELDAAVLRSLSVTSMAASDSDVFVCAVDPSQSGYSVWRMNRDLNSDSSEVVMEGLRGCCGQMDIQCCDGKLVVSENASFRVGIYDRDGQKEGRFGSRDRSSRSGFGSCCNPMNTLPLSDGTILTAESSIGHIKRFDTDGNLVAYIGKASIGGGCKHCSLGYDEKQDLYYMMYQDKDAICVMANRETAPLTPADKKLAQRQSGFLTRAAGTWSLPSEKGKKKSSGIFSALFGGGRGGDSQHPISELKLESDGKAKILAGMYKAYGDKAEIELLESDNVSKTSIPFALSIDQVRFLEGTWEFKDNDTAKLSFVGQSDVTLTRRVENPPLTSVAGQSEAPGESCEATCAGKDCQNKSCEDKGCPNAEFAMAAKSDQATRIVLADASGESISEDSLEVAPADVTIRPSMSEDEIMEDPITLQDSFAIYDSEMPTPKYEYKLLSKKKLGKDAQQKLNKLGAQGWEYCGRVDKKMMFKRIHGFIHLEDKE